MSKITLVQGPAIHRRELKHTHPLKGLGFRPPRLGVRLPVARDALPISDEEYKQRLDAFMRAHGYPSSGMGFLGNWSFRGRLEEEFRHLLKEELSLHTVTEPA